MNRNIRISRESDYILDNLKLKARQQFHKTIYKRDIADWCIKKCLTSKAAEEKFLKWAKAGRQ